MKVYYQGRYYCDNCTLEDREYLKVHAPHLHNKLFPVVMPAVNTVLNKRGVHIYQVYFDEKSKSRLDGGFIPYPTGANHNFENDILIDIWRRRDWLNARYVGVLSWRFFEKTGLISDKLKLSNDVTVFYPRMYQTHPHPYMREEYAQVLQLVDIADKYKLFPFRLRNYKVKQDVWCNYWIAKPAIFDDYIRRYLIPAIEFFKPRPEYDLMTQHRGKMYFTMTFFLEGLFSIYLQEEKINYKVIQT